MLSRNVLVPVTALALLALSVSAGADEVADEADADRTISVSGQASVVAQPDIARISMTVVERNESLGAAQQVVSDVSGRVLALFDELKIDRKQIDSTGVVIRPDYRWNRAAEEQELIGYIVERRIMVELRDMEKLGTLIERAVRAGINQMSPPAFDHTDRAGLQRRALADAVRDARANADAMAAAAGARVGAVINMHSGGRAPEPRPMLRAMAADSMVESAAETYVPGEMRFEAGVNIVYEIAP